MDAIWKEGEVAGKRRKAPWGARSPSSGPADSGGLKVELRALPGPAASCLPGLLDLGNRGLEAKGGV